MEIVAIAGVKLKDFRSTFCRLYWSEERHRFRKASVEHDGKTHVAKCEGLRFQPGIYP